MPITNEQINKLINMIATVQPDALDCDGCSKHLAEFAETHLLGKSLEESQKAVQAHLQNCHCCEAEFQSLLAALEGAAQEDTSQKDTSQEGVDEE